MDLYPLPPGVLDPLTECELALEMNMTLAELYHGRGTPMSAHELSVVWPCYFEAKRRMAQAEYDKQQGSL